MDLQPWLPAMVSTKVGVEGSKEEGLGLLLRGSPTSVFPNWAIFDLQLQEDIEDENDKRCDL